MYKPIIHRSKTINKNHLSIIVRAEDNEKAEKIIGRLKRTVHKLNRQENISVSFEIFKNTKVV